MSISALQAAKVACEASGWKLTNLQLQKILYMAHMVFAGRHHGAMLIDDDRFEAWDYGPVSPSVYHYVSSFGPRPIENIFRRVEDPHEGEEVSVIREAVKSLGHLPAFRLVNITHAGIGAWNANYKPGVYNSPIPQEDIVKEYVARYNNAR